MRSSKEDLPASKREQMTKAMAASSLGVVDMKSSRSPLVHLWIYNHPFCRISDQVEFLKLTLCQNGYRMSVGRRPKVDALNVVIENFSETTSEILCDFCRSTGKRVVVIMTEHLDFIGNQIYIHGDPLWQDNDYMLPETQLARIKNLMDCAPYIRSFMVLGDLPGLKNLDLMFSGITVRSIPFPRLEQQPPRTNGLPANSLSDLAFTGYMTTYRQEILSSIEKKLGVSCPGKFVSRRVRDSLNRASKIVLNIPQRRSWRWLSLMRVIAALRCGRATISLGTRDDSKIAACCTQLDIERADWVDALYEQVEKWESLYHRSVENYAAMADSYGKKVGFPHDLFDYWTIVECLSV